MAPISKEVAKADEVYLSQDHTGRTEFSVHVKKERLIGTVINQKWKYLRTPIFASIKLGNWASLTVKIG